MNGTGSTNGTNTSALPNLIVRDFTFETKDSDFTGKGAMDVKATIKNTGTEETTYAFAVSGYSNWASLLLMRIFGIYEIAITGEEADFKRQELEKNYIPNKILLGGKAGSLPLLQDKWDDKTRIFVCQNRTCQMPVEHVSDALKQII